MVRVEKMKHINIYSDKKNGFVVHNTRKAFDDGHTHINSYSTARYIAYLAIYRRIPKKKHLSIYLIDSVIRISDDAKYINQMKHFKEEMIEKKNGKCKTI